MKISKRKFKKGDRVAVSSRGRTELSSGVIDGSIYWVAHDEEQGLVSIYIEPNYDVTVPFYELRLLEPCNNEVYNITGNEAMMKLLEGEILKEKETGGYYKIENGVFLFSRLTNLESWREIAMSPYFLQCYFKILSLDDENSFSTDCSRRKIL